MNYKPVYVPNPNQPYWVHFNEGVCLSKIYEVQNYINQELKSMR